MSMRDGKATSTNTSTDRVLPKSGLRPARLVGLIDVGIQPQEWKGEPKPDCREIVFVFELPSDTYETDSGEKVTQIRSTWPVKHLPGQEKSNYFALVSALDPNSEKLGEAGTGDVTKLLGATCFAKIVHQEGKEGQSYANIAKKGITEIPDDYPVADSDREYFFFDTCEPDPKVAADLSDFHKNEIRGSVGYIGSDLEKVIEGEEVDSSSDDSAEDDAPF